MTEVLLAIPVLLLLGLGVLQWVLVFFAHHALTLALHEGARAGSVDHASPAAVERGTARGLVPLLYGASSVPDHAAKLVLAQRHVSAARVAGWLVIRQLSPTPASFADWAEPARDDLGNPIAGVREIPNDNLSFRWLRQPAQAAAALPGGGEGVNTAPIGARSGQSLADANLLKLELRYGVALQVLLVAPIAVWIMERIDDCAGAPATRRLGALDLGDPRPAAGAVGGASTSPERPGAWRCPFYRGRDEQGRVVMRWPIRVSATIRMQSPARSADNSIAAGAVPAPGPGLGLGLGPMDDAAAWRPASIARVSALGQSAAEDRSVIRGPGFLAVGGDRAVFGLGACEQP